MIVDTYLYNTCIDILKVDQRLYCRKINRAMNTHNIKIHKGVDNTIHFRVRDTDLKSVSVSDMTVLAKIYNRENNEKVLEKYLKIGDKCGWLALELYEGELVNVQAGHYKLVLLQENYEDTSVDYYSQTPFYTDQINNIDFDVTITEQGLATPELSIEINSGNITSNYSIGEPVSYYTSALPCNAIKNHLNSVHTFAIYLDNFTGKIELYGTLDFSPPTTLSQYFPVVFNQDLHYVEYDNYTGIDAFSFEANLTWVKFKIIDLTDPADQGSFQKILWRS